MKTAVILATLCVTYVVAHKRFPLMRTLIRAYDQCVETTNPDEGTERLVRHGRGFNDEKANCLRACTLKEAGLMQDAALDFSRLKDELNTGDHANPERTDRIIGDIKGCQEDAEASGDECTVAGKYAECVHNLRPPGRKHHKDDQPE